MGDSIKKYNEMMEDGKWSTDSTGYSYNNIPKDPIVQRVVNKFHSRSRDGIIKYGTTLYDSYSFLNHLQEELMDACLYIQKIKDQK
jgi:PhoPQ-activated pathogenicity-related protein